jgi:hypothetical protein
VGGRAAGQHHIVALLRAHPAPQGSHYAGQAAAVLVDVPRQLFVLSQAVAERRIVGLRIVLALLQATSRDLLRVYIVGTVALLLGLDAHHSLVVAFLIL